MHVFAACFTPRLDRVLQRDPDALVERARACVTLEQHAHYVPERASTLQCRRRLIADQVGSSCSSDASYDGDFQGFTSARRFRCTVQMDGVSVATVCVLPTWHRSYEHMAESCGVARATEASTQRKGWHQTGVPSPRFADSHQTVKVMYATYRMNTRQSKSSLFRADWAQLSIS